MKHFAFLYLGLLSPAAAQLPPPPVFEHITVQANCTFEPQSQTYRYQYFVTNPPTNTLEIWTIELSLGLDCSPGGIQSPEGWSGRTWCDERYAKDPVQFPDLPRLSWCSSEDTPNPGTTSGPFAFSINALPAITLMYVSPWTDPYWEAYLQATGEESVPTSVADPVDLGLIQKIPTLGPIGVFPGSFAHWDKFLADVAQAGQLGWIADPGLLASIQANLQAAREAAVAQDAATTNAKLQAVIDAIQAAPPGQRNEEAYALVYYNATYLQQEIPWPCEPKLVVLPQAATHPVGQTHTVTATLTNVATGLPIANNQLFFEVTEGPHAGLSADVQTNSEGKASFSYLGTKLGTDTILVHTPELGISQSPPAAKLGQATGKQPAFPGPGSSDAGGTLALPRPAASGLAPRTPTPLPAKPDSGSFFPASRTSITDCTAWDIRAEPVKVTWRGGPDLTVPLFVPPVLISSPGSAFSLAEGTENRGNLPAPASVTRYYIAKSQPVDPATAVVLGERNVPVLAPGEVSKVSGMRFTVPPSLPAGTYYLDACADADAQVVETDETNNCASSSLQLVVALMPKKSSRRYAPWPRQAQASFGLPTTSLR